MTGKSKPTISRAIKSGKLSASPNGSGGYSIDPAELARVFSIRNPEPVTGTGHMKPSVTSAVPPVEPGETALREQVASLRVQLELMRERVGDAREARDDARVERDEWRDQARAAQRLLEDARAPRRNWLGLRRA